MREGTGCGDARRRAVPSGCACWTHRTQWGAAVPRVRRCVAGQRDVPCAYGKEELAKLPNKSCTFYLLPPLVPRRFFGDHLRCCYAPGINGGLGGMGGMGGMPGMGMGQQQGYYGR